MNKYRQISLEETIDFLLNRNKPLDPTDIRIIYEKLTSEVIGYELEHGCMGIENIMQWFVTELIDELPDSTLYQIPHIFDKYLPSHIKEKFTQCLKLYPSPQPQSQ